MCLQKPVALHPGCPQTHGFDRNPCPPRNETQHPLPVVEFLTACLQKGARQKIKQETGVAKLLEEGGKTKTRKNIKMGRQQCQKDKQQMDKQNYNANAKD